MFERIHLSLDQETNQKLHKYMTAEGLHNLSGTIAHLIRKQLKAEGY